MRSSLCGVATGPTESSPTGTISLPGTGKVAPLLRRSKPGLGLGPRRGPGRLAPPVGDVPAESRIVFRSGAVAAR